MVIIFMVGGNVNCGLIPICIDHLLMLSFTLQERVKVVTVISRATSPQPDADKQVRYHMKLGNLVYFHRHDCINRDGK